MADTVSSECRLVSLRDLKNLYQRRQHEFLHGLPGVINIADDICIFGCGDTIEDANEDHDRNLVCLLDKCSDYDLHLSAKKLQFKATSVTFIGHRLTDKGLESDPAKISAITEMPRPEEKASVQRFVGMCQYLSKFCPNLAASVLPSEMQHLYGPTRTKARSTQKTS